MAPASTTTTHTYYGADLPIHMGGAEGESDSIKADVIFTYVPASKGLPDVIADKAVALNNGCVADALTPGEMRDLAQEWIDNGDGYDRCCNLAWEQRKGDYE